MEIKMTKNDHKSRIKLDARPHINRMTLTFTYTVFLHFSNYKSVKVSSLDKVCKSLRQLFKKFPDLFTDNIVKNEKGGETSCLTDGIFFY